MSTAITCKNNTILTCVGDSRIYIQNKNKLEQITRDHSASYNLYLEGKITEKDYVRFHKKNHLINSRLGGLKKKLKIDNFVLYNHEIENIMLMTDGITDCLPDEKLKILVNKYKNDTKLSDAIIDEALSYESINNDLDSLEYNNVIKAGKDNMTIAVLSKKLK